MRVLNRAHPIAHGLIYGIFERATARDCRRDLCAEQAHTKHVEFLAGNVYLAHVDEALHVHQCSRSRSSHTVLAGSGFCNESCLAHPLGQQCLTQHVIDFVRARMVQIFTLEVQLKPELLAKAVASGERAWTTGVVCEQCVELVAKNGVGPSIFKCCFKLM
ncbi:unannotated protein [freshwater metagenome]|uniref:Unannotated protein n=1 Tax=freshwater metagenome TaxID=449393 RepID=A0A6J6CQD8_9ZZZZ